MRYLEICGENFVVQRVANATSKKADAQRQYQAKMRKIPETTPKAQVGTKQAEARNQLQKSMRKADDSIRSAASQPGAGPGL